MVYCFGCCFWVVTYFMSVFSVHENLKTLKSLKPKNVCQKHVFFPALLETRFSKTWFLILKLWILVLVLNFWVVFLVLKDWILNPSLVLCRCVYRDNSAWISAGHCHAIIAWTEEHKHQWTGGKLQRRGVGRSHQFYGPNGRRRFHWRKNILRLWRNMSVYAQWHSFHV